MVHHIETVAGRLERVDKNAVDLDQALAVSGFGWYNGKYCLVLALFLMAAIIEPVGYSFVLPAAKCDLGMTDAQRGFLASVPYIGFILTSFAWGYLVDTRGRRSIVIISSLGAGLFAMLAAFVPGLIGFTVCKFLSALCLAGPATVPYAFIGEIIPQRHRDVTLSVINAMQITGSAVVPLLAWAVLPLEFRANFGAYEFRPWRLLVILNGAVFVIGAAFMYFGPESPKFLVTKGKHDEALTVLQCIYAGNNGKSTDSYPVKSLRMPTVVPEKDTFSASLRAQTVPLLRPPLVKWVLLIGFLLFGMFSTLNGLYVWVPDILNRVISGGEQQQTACQIFAISFNETSSDPDVCIDTIETQTFLINFVANSCCAVIAIGGSSLVNIVGKKSLLVTVFMVIGVFIILINFISNGIVFLPLLSSITVMGMTIGPISAFAVEIFPTHLRGMAISLGMTIGRSGSIMGTNVAGALLYARCELAFYFFGGLLLICGFMVFLLPQAQKSPARSIKGDFKSTRL